MVLVGFLHPIATWSKAPSQPAKQGSSPSKDSAKRGQDQSVEGELDHESREAAGEEKDEQSEFKKSPAVSLVARVTGLSLEHAYWICVSLNFAVIAGVVVWFSRTRLAGMFRDRTQSIRKAMEEARKASEEANQRLAEIEARLARLGDEIAAMRDKAEKDALEEEGRLKAATQEDARKVVESAEQEIAAAAKLAGRELKAFAADLAVSLAQKQIRVDTQTDQALVRSFSDQLGSAETNGGAKAKAGH
jgi:F-type H+-transporting ATPase subunit b